MPTKWKRLTVYYLAMDRVQAAGRRRMTAPEIREFFRAVKSLSTRRNDASHRYDETDVDSRFIAFFNDLNQPRWNEAPGFETFLFVKRRDTSYPWEHTEGGDLIQLQLHDAANEVAEVTYCGLIEDPGILFFVSNNFVGGYLSLQNYFNAMHARLKELGRYELILGGQAAHFELAFITNPDPEGMLDSISDVKRWTLRIAGGIEHLYDLVEHSQDIDSALAGMVRMAKETQTVNLSLEFTKGHSKNPLSKNRIKRLLASLKPFFAQNRHGHQFEVEGRGVDDQTAVIDVLNPRLVQRREVAYEGKYPNLDGIFEELREGAGMDRDTIKEGMGL